MRPTEMANSVNVVVVAILEPLFEQNEPDA
jgi:hypothetical protein